MALVPEATLEVVVTKVSQNIAHAEYISGRVDELIAVQPNLMQYVVAHKDDLSVEQIVQVLFHASIMLEGICEATGAQPHTVSFADLDQAASRAGNLESFSELEPALANFVYNNLVVETPGPAGELSGTLLAHIGGAMVAAVATS